MDARVAGEVGRNRLRRDVLAMRELRHGGFVHAAGGVLYFSNNFRRFRLDEAAVAEFADAREITGATLDPDFERNPRIHRAWELRAR